MPIYEYCCADCHKVFEEWTRRIDDKDAQPCPDCGGEARRIVSNTSFVLKGGGWYVTDYGYRKGKDEEAPSGSGGKTGGTESSGSSNSAPAGEASASAAATPSAPAAASADKTPSAKPAAGQTAA
ncbi:MAG: zinc ribbon domain-containing protein [Deltaproteobacteria bacterium]|jgi:putative FmdB family regulatory protein|nr:zinc ribbon domain-containing protein [Deltaproteobacteria bacterium]